MGQTTVGNDSVGVADNVTSGDINIGDIIVIYGDPVYSDKERNVDGVDVDVLRSVTSKYDHTATVYIAKDYGFVQLHASNSADIIRTGSDMTVGVRDAKVIHAPVGDTPGGVLVRGVTTHDIVMEWR